ncbi:MAG: hypothetical protein A3I32_00220 [Candidatus Yanofskybacteria bacterium RIFCSPLOWO2_02_FULL_45_10]|uniref:Cell division protein FtsL n=2 Tax=Candidatus Yanofskyibacteriota TaxID=1752733 RepID=A0A1F8G567_9BACT|nr:MAG: hypothetical protein A3F25_00750 [Candidatus Yanofskybacteria bacterium RIFCSPHIGHO2_12_FULL_45_19b]OGN31633.1 MAG: hypothetical protein A3I32_00220 [Candidatus Yanofskybacteria bacterium RIFCSPLOWO2_02_FULL_45_10]
MLVVAAGLVLYYVFLANRLVTIAYQEKQMNNQLADLTVRHGDLAAQQANTSTLSNLSAFAQNAGLVEQAVPDSIFSDTSLAQN